MNMFEARVTGNNVVAVGDVEFTTETDLSKTSTDNIKLGIRSEFIGLAAKKTKNAIQVDIQRVDDFGNFQLVLAHTGHNAIKVKVKREVAVPGDKAWLKFPKRRCCVYADEALL